MYIADDSAPEATLPAVYTASLITRGNVAVTAESRQQQKSTKQSDRLW